MTMKKSEAIRNGQLDVIESTIGTSGIIKFFDGTPPAATVNADSGVCIATINLPSDYMSNASGGVKAKQGTWEDTQADAAGLCRYWRAYNSAGTVCHLQGSCGMPWAPSTAVILNQQMINNGILYRCTTAGTTASSGGPTGTGSGISDGTAVWTWVDSSPEITLDNVNVALNQSVSISTFSFAASGA